MKKSKLLMILGSIFILALFIFPLWSITLEAPQYPIPLGMKIHINDFSDVHPHDIKNINLMNHYVGMQYIPETIPEFRVFPMVILIMSGLGLILGFFTNYKWYLGWFILMTALSLAGIYDFYLWEHDYGHNLDPKAIMKFTNPDGTVMGFQPPLFGSKDILNFTAHSYPQLGVYFLVLGMACAFVGYYFGRKESKSSVKVMKPMQQKVAVILVLTTLGLSSCSVEPQPIDYGVDGCHFCKMTIVDQMHAAEIVTDKGKVFKFDATECMINALKSMDKSNVALYLSANYAEPGQLIDAKKATFLINEEIPSPMGANLSAFGNRKDADAIVNVKGGQLYNWQELLQLFNK